MPKSSDDSNREDRTREFVNRCLRQLQPVLEAYGVVHLALFGSIARGENVAESDVDLIVEDRPERRIDLFDLMEIQEFLEKQLGRSVDLGTRASLRPGKHDSILAEMQEIF